MQRWQKCDRYTCTRWRQGLVQMNTLQLYKIAVIPTTCFNTIMKGIVSKLNKEVIGGHYFFGNNVHCFSAMRKILVIILRLFMTSALDVIVFCYIIADSWYYSF